jgi:hypothetical protein
MINEKFEIIHKPEKFVNDAAGRIYDVNARFVRMNKQLMLQTVAVRRISVAKKCLNGTGCNVTILFSCCKK